MTNTESRIAIEHQELARRDDADALENEEQKIAEADSRELAAYGFDSDHRTLVGLGPVERAWRSRRAAEKPDSEHGPQSDSNGPFIAEDEIPASLRGRKLGLWAVAAPTLLIVGVAAVLGLRGLAPGASRAAAASRPKSAVTAPPAQAGPPLPAQVPPPPAEVPPPPAELVAKVENASVSESTASTERARAAGPVVPAALPVKLPDLAAPAVVDMSSSADTNVGSLNVTSNPPANVVLDGRPLGKSPRIVKVPAGLHTVVFIHPLYGRQSLSVNVGAGATTGASADF
jgi:hypothetical protein